MTQTQNRTELQPHEQSRSELFGIDLEPVGGKGTDYFKIKLTYNGVEKGWLNVNSRYWAVMSPVPLILQYYTYKGETYYKIPDQGYYMSVSRHDYVGFYHWGNATTFTLEQRKLKSNYNSQYP